MALKTFRALSLIATMMCASIGCGLPPSGANRVLANGELRGPEREALAVRTTIPLIAPRLRALGAHAGDPVFMRAYKSEAILELWIQPRGQGRYVRFAAWPICAASGTLGPKLREGDKQVPEGVYGITAAAMNNQSSYHLSMNTGYPNALDRALGRTGSEIMVHGRCASIGCLAMTDSVINEVWTLVSAAHANGQQEVPIHIYPFVMTNAAMATQATSPHRPFWSDLKAIHDRFEATKMLVNVRIEQGRYSVASAR